MRWSGALQVFFALFVIACVLLVPSHAAVAPPIYGPFSPVFIGAETNQFGYYASVVPAGPFQSNFEGIDAVQWHGATSHIANPNGAVGPKQYVQWTQGGFQAYDKLTGAPLLCQVSTITNKCPNNVATPVSWGEFWDGSPGSNVYECGHGSPSAGVLLYDQLDEVIGSAGAQLHGHWIIGTHVDHGVHAYLCIAVSTDSDILHSSWHQYEFQLDGNGSGGKGGVLPYSSCTSGCITGLYPPDYLKLGTSVEVKKTGTTFVGGLYATWDLYAPPLGPSVAGFETCALNRNDLVNGHATTAMSCYYYLPSTNLPWGGPKSAQSIIHSLVPADFEGASSPPNSTLVEYFLATVNPYTGTLASNTACLTPLCTSHQLALFTLGTDASHPLRGPTLLPVKAFTPGCYNTVNVKDTFCVPQPTSGALIDSIGDRLMHRLAYRFVSVTGTEQLVSAQTIFNGATKCTGRDSTPCTTIQWYKIINPGNATKTILQGPILDSGHGTNFLFMPSVATNSAGNLQVTFAESGDSAHASLYTVPVTFTGLGGTGAAQEGIPQRIIAGTGDELDSDIFGEYYSTTIDPCDDTTFWGTGEYFATNETSATGFNWHSRIYTTAKTTPKVCSF
jgi:hypothetical protein